jgi:hypothetical protein
VLMLERQEGVFVMRTRLERRRHDYYRNSNLRKKFLHSFSFFFSLFFNIHTKCSTIYIS